MMDCGRIIEALGNTLVADKQEHAAKSLKEMHKIIGFVPSLLNVVMEESVDVGIRQAAALYLKNNVSEWWEAEEPDAMGDLKFSIHEQDKAAIRNSIVTAVVSSPLPLQSQLKMALRRVIELDFPDRFGEFPEQVKHYMLSSDHMHWHGSLVCLHTFVKAFEYKRHNVWRSAIPTLKSAFPVLRSAMANLLSDNSDKSYILQTLICKIFFGFIHFNFPLDAIDKESLGPWVDSFCTALSNFTNLSSEESAQEWKLKKWCLKILSRVFTRYGSPGGVVKKYTNFAEWYLKAFSHQVLSVLLNICEAYRQKTFVSKVVLSETLEYFIAALAHSFTWKILQPRFPLLVQEVIFPLLSHSEEDEELWQSDPVEYIRQEPGEWSTASNPKMCAFTLLNEACLKRRGVLDKVMPFCVHILTSNSTPVEKDAVLHMYGAMAEFLLKSKSYNNQLEPFLLNHVLPTLHAPEGYRRARACWLLGKLSAATFTNESVFTQVVEQIRKSTCFDPELPVRSSAALCLIDLVKSQESTHQLLVPHLNELLTRVLELLRLTEIDNLNEVIEGLIVAFEDEITPIAAQLLQSLSDTFMQLIQPSEDKESEDENECDDSDVFEYKSVVATNVLGNMESVLSLADEHPNLVAQFEPIMINVIQAIFNRNLNVFFDEALTLMFSLTTANISPSMWQLFDQLYPVFQKDSCECFTEMMPCLHNYITVDHEAFLSDPKRIEQITLMLSEVFAIDGQEEMQTNAAKLLEVLLIDYRNRIDTYAPKYIELALARLTRRIVSRELRTVCLQVVIAGFLYSPTEVLSMMVGHNWPGTDSFILIQFVKHWFEDVGHVLSLHARRLYVLGICLLISLPACQRPEAMNSISKDFLPTLLSLFSGLKKAYALKAKKQNEDDSSDDDDDDDDEDEDLEGKALGSDEDDVDKEGAHYLNVLESYGDGSSAEEDGEVGDGDAYSDDSDVDSILDEFDTQIDKPDCDMDEYVTFYRVMTNLEANDSPWYNQLVSQLTAHQQGELRTIVDTALKCIQQKESKLIEQAGGYTFQTTIPKSFDFGSPSNKS